jgi:predicted ferric reductase
VLSALHGLLLLGDRTFAFTPLAIAFPFASPYAPRAVGVGQLAFYAIALVAASFYVRRRIGQRAWRLVHYLTFLAFAGVTMHGIASGTDTLQPWALWLYGVPLSAVAFLVVYRLIVGLAERRMVGGTSRVLVAQPRRARR